jgi:hypothetical protein
MAQIGSRAMSDICPESAIGDDAALPPHCSDEWYKGKTITGAQARLLCAAACSF